MERIEKTLDPQAPAYMVRGPEQMIDDGCEYDRGFDPRPEIVKEDDRARRIRRETFSTLCGPMGCGTARRFGHSAGHF